MSSGFRFRFFFLTILSAGFAAAPTSAVPNETPTETVVPVTALPNEDAAPRPFEERDVLAEALAVLGATRADLGTRANPMWTRFPYPGRIPHTTPFFDGVYSQPLRLYDLARTMGNAVEHFLAPGALDSEPQALYRLVYYLGVDKRHVGFRDYSANLPEPRKNVSLAAAIADVYAFAQQETETRSFGKTAQAALASIDTEIATLPAELQRIVANLVYALLDASRWQRLAVRNVPTATLAACWQTPALGEFAGGSETYYPQVDDAEQHLDQASLDYAGMKTVQAAQDARRELKTWLAKTTSREKKVLEGAALAHRTPLGWIVVRGTRDDEHTVADALLLIDVGGNDRYTGSVGASTAAAPISVCIDLEGHDEYNALEEPSLGAGVFGAGVLIDVSGDDTYQAGARSQGYGFFGTGLLVDEAGKDRYSLRHSGQGCGYFGIGLCFDVEGDDDYTILGDGQGFGGVGAGVGVLADYSGRDHYMADPFLKVAERNERAEIRVSNAQGVGKGRRGDGSDGHDWAGGVGAILDIAGDDTYESGNWSLGAGYWFGTGVAFDRSGDDLYRSVYFTQGAGAHYANGVLVDEAGQDQHVLFETAGAAFGFGWDYANALFLNKSGDDRYEAMVTSFGRADIRSTALFFDLDGDDRYQFGKGQLGLGAADFRDSYATPDPFAPYQSESSCFGIWIDAGGVDEYTEWDPEKHQRSDSITWGNDRSWRSPAPGTTEHGYANHGLGMDVPGGTIPEFFRFDSPPLTPTSLR